LCLFVFLIDCLEMGSYGINNFAMDCFRFPGGLHIKQVCVVWMLLIAGVLSACTAPVVLEPLAKPGPSQLPAPLLPAHPVAPRTYLAAIQFTIQVGAFSTTERAADYAAGLMQLGLDAYYFIDDDGLFKVRFDRFDSHKAACQRAKELQTLGWIGDYFIVQPIARHSHIDPRQSLRQKIVRTAGRFLGTAYRWGGESVHDGFDCSGLTMTVYRLNGLDLPRNSRDQFRAGTPIKRSALRKGDLVFFATGRRRRVSHVGIYTGGGHFIHAPGRGKLIGIASLSNSYFNRRFVGARRYF
jgi:gamma-D-glutamyl-L-lysine dipeptidyl-peptidase